MIDSWIEQLGSKNPAERLTAENALINSGTAAEAPLIAILTIGVNLVVDVRGGNAWIKVWVDGKVASPPGGAGDTLRSGETLTFTGERSIEVRTGSSGVTYFTLNGQSLGALGRSGIPETWLFQPPDPPTKTSRT